MAFFLFRRRTRFMFLGTLALLFFAQTTWRSFGLGLPLVVVGMMIRIWSAGCLEKMDRVVSCGPFSLCRNPLYLGSFLMTLGYTIMCGRVDVAVLCVAGFWVFHAGAISYEERMLSEKFGDAFREYSKRVPRIIPRLSFAGCSGGFSWNLMKRNREHRAVLIAAIVVVLFGLWAYFDPPLELIGQFR